MPKKGERPRLHEVLREKQYLSFEQFLLDAEVNGWCPAEMARQLSVTINTLKRWLEEHGCAKRIVYRRIAA